MINFDYQEKTNLKSDDRIIELAPMEGQFPKDSMGLTDKRLFTGGNKLHAIHDTRLRLWHLRYELGGLPEPLKQKWTKFSDLLKTVELYFKKRNVRITNIIE